MSLQTFARIHCLFGLFLTILTFPGQAEGQTMIVGTDGRCLTVGTDAFEGRVEAMGCGLNVPEQQFVLPPRAFSGEILNLDGLCMDIDLVLGIPVMKTCDGSPSQRWRFGQDGWIATPDGLCIGITDDLRGTVEPRLCLGNLNQIWRRAALNRFSDLGPEGFSPSFLVESFVLSSETLFSQVDGAGLFLSQDGAQSWSPLDSLPDPHARIQGVDSLDPNQIYAVSNSDCTPATNAQWRSDDAGRSWINLPQPSPEILAIATVPNAPTRIYSMDAAGTVFRSDDEGLSWTRRGELPFDEPLIDFPRTRAKLLVDPSDTRILYAAINRLGCSPSPLEFFLFKTLDRGASWELIWQETNLFNGLGDLQLDPHNPEQLFWVGNDVLRRSQDGGFTWRSLGPGNFDNPATKLLIDPIRPGHLILGAGRGIYATRDGGQNWRPSELLDATLIGISPDGSTVFARRDNLNLLVSRDFTSSWTPISARGLNNLRVLDLEHLVPDTALIVTSPNTFFSRLHRTQDGGRTWIEVASGIQGLAVDSQNSDRILAHDSFELSRSTDGGLSFEQFDNYIIDHLTAHPQRANTFFAVRAADPLTHVEQTTNFGTSWRRLTNVLNPAPGPLALSADGGTFYLPSLDPEEPAWISRDEGESWQSLLFSARSIVTHPNEVGTAWAAAWNPNDGEYRLRVSFDDGVSWNPVATPRAVDHLEVTATSLYFASEHEVWRSRDQGASWTEISAGLPPTPISVLEADPDKENRLWLGSSTHGAFVGDFAPGLRAGDPVLAVAPGDQTFEVTVDWRDFEGKTGRGTAIPLTDETGVFWFFNDSNLELMVKVLDGRSINNKFWVFYGSLSNVEYKLSVKHLQTGAVREYFNPLGSFGSTGDIQAFNAPFPNFMARAKSETIQVGTSPTLTLEAGGRLFEVTVDWRDFEDRTGFGRAVPLTDETGAFWFFNPENLEVMIKVLDGRSINGKFWVFFGALSNVEYRLTVRDLATGAVRTFDNPIGEFGSVGDTAAFDP